MSKRKGRRNRKGGDADSDGKGVTDHHEHGDTEHGDAEPDEEDASALLSAARDGWGTSIRYAMLRAIDRWPSIVLGGTAGGVTGAVSAVARAKGWI